MLATVVTVVATGDLSRGVIVGVLLSGVFFAGKVSRLVRVTTHHLGLVHIEPAAKRYHYGFGHRRVRVLSRKLRLCPTRLHGYFRELGKIDRTLVFEDGRAGHQDMVVRGPLDLEDAAR